MFTYLHSYHPEVWDATVRSGLFHKNDGIRFCESIMLPEDLKFNVLAARGTPFYDTVKALRCPMYIDRLQGGTYIEAYPYDKALLDDYRAMLGDRFLGFQMHEWMSNLRNDYNKLQKGRYESWTEKGITDAVRRQYDYKWLFLEAMTAAEFAALPFPETPAALYNIAESLFIKRQCETDGGLIPCDSYFLSHRLELRCGAKRIMPEIGAQTPDTRIQLSYARGMAKAYGAEYGAYYEPWGGDPFSSCCYQKDGRNEWNLSGADFPFETNGFNGGSSRSMQRRMHLYAYMAGASFMSEEWGLCNTFYDWNDFGLSPYGAVKKEFLDFTEKYPDIGTLLTPVAVVLPSSYGILEGVFREDAAYLGYPYDNAHGHELQSIRKDLRELFTGHAVMRGSECRSLVNCPVPDALDIVHADRFDADAYTRLIDLSHGELDAKYRDKCVSVEDAHAMLDALLPCVVKGDVHKMVTRRKDGTHFLILFNNSGVVRTAADGETFDREADTSAAVVVKDGKPLTMLEGDAAVKRADDGTYHIDIPAGGYFFGRF